MRSSGRSTESFPDRETIGWTDDAGRRSLDVTGKEPAMKKMGRPQLALGAAIYLAAAAELWRHFL
jgi:hypothetical protein